LDVSMFGPHSVEPWPHLSN